MPKKRMEAQRTSREMKTKEQFVGECLLRSQQLDKADVLCKILGVDRRQFSSKVKHHIAEVPQIGPLKLEN